MKVGPFRIETDWFEGDEARTSRSFGFNVPETDVPDHVVDAVHELIEDLRAAGVREPAGALITELMVRKADDAAYRREAERRGVLAL